MEYRDICVVQLKSTGMVNECSLTFRFQSLSPVCISLWDAGLVCTNEILPLPTVLIPCSPFVSLFSTISVILFKVFPKQCCKYRSLSIRSLLATELVQCLVVAESLSPSLSSLFHPCILLPMLCQCQHFDTKWAKILPNPASASSDP